MSTDATTTDTTTTDPSTDPAGDATPTGDATAAGGESRTVGQTSSDRDSGHRTGQHDDEAEHLSDNRYIVIALILAVITAAEVAASYIDLGPVFIPLLLIMMAVKFLTVVLYFMHLKFDNKLFKRLFYTGLILAVFVYCAALLTFRFFDS
ncbi:cytochrome C oxidase subunit IV family protein [Ilumatobacter sp.]|uniref:cytochrome C oxidase subunit IV family protein n=1 Tax=Ilumatobacter sp. TaxID=1967498 RepID=UPI003B520F8B